VELCSLFSGLIGRKKRAVERQLVCDGVVFIINTAYFCIKRCTGVLNLYDWDDKQKHWWYVREASALEVQMVTSLPPQALATGMIITSSDLETVVIAVEAAEHLHERHKEWKQERYEKAFNLPKNRNAMRGKERSCT